MGGIHFSPVNNLWLQHRKNWNLIRRRLKRKIMGKTISLQYTEKVNISNPIEAYIKEV